MRIWTVLLTASTPQFGNYRGRLRAGNSEMMNQLTTKTALSWFKLCGAKGNRTPDLLDANESRYQLRHSP